MIKWLKRAGLAIGLIAVFIAVQLLPIQQTITPHLPQFAQQIVQTAQKQLVTIGIAGVAYAVTPDYVVDGIADDVQAQLALDALPATGGELLFYGGNYVFDATVLRAINNVTISGSGKSTYFAHDGATPLFSAGAQTGWIFRDFRTDAGYLTVSSGLDTIVSDVYNNTTLVGKTVRESSFVVAGLGASNTQKSQADYICDGTADDVQTQAAISALTAGRTWVEVVKLVGHFHLAATVTMPSYTFVDAYEADFDLTALGASYAFTGTGTVGGAKVLTAQADSRETSVSVASGSETGFVKGDLVRIRSEEVLDAGYAIKSGEIHVVESNADTIVNLYDALIDTYSLANTATIDEITPVRDIGIAGGTFTNDGTDDSVFASFTYCYNLTLEDITVKSCAFRAFDLTTCVNVSINNNRVMYSNRAGYGYGVVVGAGSQWVWITNSYFLDCRHWVTGGGATGEYGMNRWVTVQGNKGEGGISASIDSHSASQYWDILDNNLMNGDAGMSVTDGFVTWQGREVNIRRNTCPYSLGHGIFIQPSGTATINFINIEENSVSYTAGGGVYVQAVAACTINNLRIWNNTFINPQSTAIHVNADTAGCVIDHFVIEGNSIIASADHVIYLNHDAGTSSNGIIANNDIKTTGAYTPIRLFGVHTLLHIHGNRIAGGSIGIYDNGDGCTGVIEGNYITGTTTPITVTTAMLVRNNPGVCGKGEVMSVSKAITAGVQNTVTSIQNTFGRDVDIVEAMVTITAAASAANPTYDMGTDSDGTGAPSVGLNLFDGIPDTVGYYRATSAGLGGDASGKLVQPIIWQASGNDWVNFIIMDANGADTAGVFYLTVIGE